MRIVELSTVDLSTKEGRLQWLEYKNDSNWKLISDAMGTEAVFERTPDEVSNCCEAKVIQETDICSKCKEHCQIIYI